MIQSWPEINLGELIFIKHGFAFKGEYFTSKGDYILLTPGNFGEAGGLKLKGEKEKYYSSTFPMEFLLKRDDLLVVMTDLTQEAAILGASAIIPDSNRYLHNQRLGKIFIKAADRIDHGFLYHLFNYAGVREQIKATASGATVRHTSPGRIYDVKAHLPPIHTQRKIASILSAYDNLIDNNARRVQVLDDMTRTLYREWFVEYRYPGHEDDEFIEDDNGRRPKEWEETTLGERFITILGGTPARAKPQYWGGEVPWLNSGKANDLRVIEPSEYITVEGYKKSSTKMMPAGATIIAITGATLGQVSRLEIYACGNQSLVGLWGYEDYQNTFIYLSTKLNWITQIVSKAGGGAQQHVNKDKINETKLLLPPENILKDFDDRVGPLFGMIRSLLFRNANLRRTRDLLLPKLVSGELDVSTLDVQGVEEQLQEETA